MKHYPSPKLINHQRFKDIEALSRVVGWDADFRQIDPGPLSARAVVLGHADIRVARVEFDRRFHQVGSPPQGAMTFGLPDKRSGILIWSGAKTPPPGERTTS